MTYGHFCLLYSHGTRPRELRPTFLGGRGSKVGRTSVEVMDHRVSRGSSLQSYIDRPKSVLYCVQFGRSSSTWPSESRPRFAWHQGSEVMDHRVSRGSSLQELIDWPKSVLYCVQFGRSGQCVHST